MEEKFYKVDGQLRAEIDVNLTHEHDAPSIKACRYAVLELARSKVNNRQAYVIYDRLLNRIVNGVYYMPLKDVLECAQDYNVNPDAPDDMSPNGAALSLHYPTI